MKRWPLLSSYQIPTASFLLESAHALAEVVKLAPGISADQIIMVNLSGRGDKDVQHVARIRGIELC
jgi:tryptophan synthase beta chain